MTPSKIPEIYSVFFKLGITAFGGPAAHIALMQNEIVEKRRWLSDQEFLDLLGATQLIPGPNSTEMAMHCGYKRGGFWGLIAAGVAFILPAFCLTLALAWGYVQFAAIPVLDPFLFGIKPAMIAVIFFALLKLSKKACKTGSTVLIGLLVGVAILLGVSEILALFMGGLIGGFYVAFKRSRTSILSVSISALPVLWDQLISSKLGRLFFECLKIGSVLYGSGYVLIAYVETTFVHQLGWLTPEALLDAVAIGQLTPGPVLTTATVIGYFLLGYKGAVLATIGIFLPSFFFVLALNPLIAKLRGVPVLSGFLDGVNASAVALMAVVTLKLSVTVLTQWESMVILAFACLFMGIRIVNANVLLLIGLSSVLGYVLLIL